MTSDTPRAEALWSDLEAASHCPGPLMTITKAQYGALLATRAEARPLDVALLSAYRDYTRSSEGAGAVQPRVVQRLIEAVYDLISATSATGPKIQVEAKEPDRE